MYKDIRANVSYTFTVPVRTEVVCYFSLGEANFLKCFPHYFKYTNKYFTFKMLSVVSNNISRL